MLYALIIVSVLLVLSLVALTFAAIFYFTAKNDAYHYLEQWKKWENRWWVANTLVQEKFNYRIRIDGLPSENSLVPLAKDRSC